jgi:hypothetical protein
VVTGLEFGYTGGATQHHISDLEFVTPAGTLTGNLTLGATAPFAIAGALAFVGDGDYRDASARANLSGTLEALGLDANVIARCARDRQREGQPVRGRPTHRGGQRRRSISRAGRTPCRKAT